ncbi:MAG: hypothetical protein HY460_03250 [Parcubacteria group bacterium]|nr:hypothetical protein [Parcubacteria group bacterium]
MREFNPDRMAWFFGTIAGIARGVNETKRHGGGGHAVRIEMLKRVGIPESDSFSEFRAAVVHAEARGPLSGADILELIASALKGYNMYEALRPKE